MFFRLPTKVIQKATAAAPSLCRAPTVKPTISFPSSATFANQMVTAVATAASSKPEEVKMSDQSFIAANPLLKRTPSEGLFPKMKSIKDLVAEDVENLADLAYDRLMMEILKEIVMHEKELDVKLTQALLCKLSERD